MIETTPFCGQRGGSLRWQQKTTKELASTQSIVQIHRNFIHRKIIIRKVPFHDQKRKGNNHQHNREMTEIESMPDLCPFFITLQANVHFKFPVICNSCLPALLQPRENGKISDYQTPVLGTKECVTNLLFPMSTIRIRIC